MKGKIILTALLSLLAVIGLILALGACAPPPEDHHEHSYTASVTQPTCTEDGYTVYTCACGDRYSADTVPATGHSYDGGVVTAPTCTQDGYTTYTCACGDSYTANAVTASHSWVKGEVVPVGCITLGYTTYVCSVCSESKMDDYVAYTGHSYKQTVVKPTCTAEGYTETACVGCDNSSVSNTVSALGHSYNRIMCTRCLDLLGTDGLTFAWSDELGGYTVTGVSDMLLSQIVIPASYEGEAVVGIEDGAFRGARNLHTVLLPSTVTSLDESVFEDSYLPISVYSLAERGSLSVTAEGLTVYYHTDEVTPDADDLWRCTSGGILLVSSDGSFVAPEIPEARHLELVFRGEAVFNIVTGEGISADVSREVNSIIDSFKAAGVTVRRVSHTSSSNISDCEIIVGNVDNREGCSFDCTPLGKQGYVIKMVGDRIVITGKTNESTLAGLLYFKEHYLGIGKEDSDLTDVTLSRGIDIEVAEQYNITSIDVGGTDLSEYKLCYDPADMNAKQLAEKLSDLFYTNAGYVVPAVTDAAVGDKLIYVRILPQDKSTDGFVVRVTDGNMYIECHYADFLMREADSFTSLILPYEREGAVSFPEAYRYSVYMHNVYYSDFGVAGDGVTDDFEAIKEAHEYANRYNFTVVADEGATYHMGAHDTSIMIRTDVVWTGATFIIDDSGIAPEDKAKSVHVFTVASDKPSFSVSISGPLNKGDTNVGVTFDGNYLLIIKDSNIKQYIRYGLNADEGDSQQEIILVDKGGNIDPTTPLLWNYGTVTSAVAYSADDAPITVTGGTFITIANQAPRAYTYYERGISIQRSNTTMRGITHRIEGEGSTGAPYNGFLAVSKTTNVLFDSIVYTGHKTYKLATNENNSMGTYDISANSANKVTWRGCTQTNDINDTTCWGIMGSNYCKNLTYDGCKLSRFDAHKGMYNTVIINSELGHVGINAIGAGTLLVQNTVIHKNYAINLRNDYGSTWEGDIILRDVTLMNTNTGYPVTLFNGVWTDHDFGYTCYLPATITIDNLTLANGTTVYVLPDFGRGNIASAATSNPVVLTENIIIRNNRNGYTFHTSQNSYISSAATLTEIPVTETEPALLTLGKRDGE